MQSRLLLCAHSRSEISTLLVCLLASTRPTHFKPDTALSQRAFDASPTFGRGQADTLLPCEHGMS